MPKCFDKLQVQSAIDIVQNSACKLPPSKIFSKYYLKNLNKIGYQKVSQKNLNFQKKVLIKAFQRRFRQRLINGISDQECLIISKNLLKS